MAIETLYADAHLAGAFLNPANAIGNTPDTWAGELDQNTNYTSRWSMANPTEPLTAGATQTVNVLTRKGLNSGDPSIAVNLYINGVLQTSGATVLVTSTTGEIKSYNFSTDQITDRDAVEIEVVQTSAGGSPSVRNCAQIAYIEWQADVTAVVPTSTGDITSGLPSLTQTASGDVAAPSIIDQLLPSFTQAASGTFEYIQSEGYATGYTSGYVPTAATANAIEQTLPSLTQSAGGSFTAPTEATAGYSAKALELGATVVYAENVTLSQWDDESANAKHLTVVAEASTSIVDGPGDGLPNGLALGGATDRASHPDDPVFQFTGNHTFVFWVQRSATVQDQWAQYFGKGDNPSYMIRQWDTDDNSIMYHLRGAVDTQYVQLPINTLPVDAWAMVIARYDGTNMLLRVLDITGTVINEVSVNKGVIDFDPGAQAFSLGAQNDTGTSWRREIRARMAGAAIFDGVALTDQQILDLHASAITAPPAGNTAESILPTFTQSASGSVAVPVDTGDIAQTLPSLQQSASGSFAQPVDAGNITSGLPSFSQSADGTVTTPVDVGNITSELPSFTQSASGSFAQPVDTGDITSGLPSLTQSASGSFVKPSDVGDITSTLPSLTQAAEGTVTKPVYTGSAESVLPSFVQGASGSISDPVDVGDITSVLPSLTQDAGGTVTAPAGAGDITSVLPVFQQSASGSVTEPVDVGDITSRLPALTQQASGSVEKPVYTGEATSTIPSLQQSASGSVSDPVDAGDIVSGLPSLQQSATGSFAQPTDVGSITTTLPSFEQTASGTFTEPAGAGTITSILPALDQSATATFTQPAAMPDPGYLYVHSATERQTLDIASAGDKQLYVISVPVDSAYLDIAAAMDSQLATVASTPERTLEVQEADVNKVEI